MHTYVRTYYKIYYVATSHLYTNLTLLTNACIHMYVHMCVHTYVCTYVYRSFVMDLVICFLSSREILSKVTLSRDDLEKQMMDMRR